MDLDSWVTSGQFKAPKVQNKTNFAQSIAKSRAESRASYRSKTSKLERRKDKKQAFLKKLEFEDKLSQINRKSGPKKEKLTEKLYQEMGNPIHSGAQADIALHKLAEKRMAKKNASGVGKKSGSASQQQQNDKTVNLLKQLKDASNHKAGKSNMKKGRNKKLEQNMLSHIEMMKQKMKEMNS